MSQIDNDFLDDIFGQFEGIEDEYDEEANSMDSIYGDFDSY